jgi:very-short-patch-repair endonuclease
LDWLVRTQRLTTLLPGVYAPARLASDPMVKIRAAMLWAPDAVLTGPAAAMVSYWPQLKVPVITLALGRQTRTHPAGYQLTRASIPPELVEERRGVRYTTPALTALDLCEVCEGDGIDTVLRTRAATLAEMHRAMELTRGRAGNRTRRTLLLDSRDEPWSKAERVTHRLLRGAGIVGWKSNFEIPSAKGSYFLDVAFERERVALEIDGRLHEEDGDLFESDRWRQNFVVLQDWRVLRFTWNMVDHHPDSFLRTVFAVVPPKTSLQIRRHRRLQA